MSNTKVDTTFSARDVFLEQPPLAKKPNDLKVPGNKKTKGHKQFNQDQLSKMIYRQRTSTN